MSSPGSKTKSRKKRLSTLNEVWRRVRGACVAPPAARRRRGARGAGRGPLSRPVCATTAPCAGARLGL